MTKSGLMRNAAISAGTTMLFSFIPHQAAAEEGHPENREQETMNILFIPVDDLRPELGCYGNSIVHTPNIDSLAARGTVFMRNYCQQALSNPSRSSMLTGYRPDRVGVWDLNTFFRDIHPDVVTLPQYFKENGYTSIDLGKCYHNTFPDSLSWSEIMHDHRFPFDPDATYVDEENLFIQAAKIAGFKSRNDYSPVDQLGHWYVKANSTECSDVEDNAYYDGVQAEMATARLRELAASGEPFFFSVGFYRPHLPFNAPEKYWDMYDREEIPLPAVTRPPLGSPSFALGANYEIRRYDDLLAIGMRTPAEMPMPEDLQRKLIHGYYASISYVDAQIGKLVRTLRETGLDKNTIIVIWGDNGFKLGEYNAWCKQSNYEIDTRVPLIIVDPRQKIKGDRNYGLTELLDVYPTLCELAGLPLPEHLQGRSLAKILNDEEAEGKEYAFSQFLRGRYVYDEGKYQQMGYAVRTDRYRYVEWYEWNPEENRTGRLIARELYDHSTDPEETFNLAVDEAMKPVMKKLSKAIRDNSMF